MTKASEIAQAQQDLRNTQAAYRAKQIDKETYNKKVRKIMAFLASRGVK